MTDENLSRTPAPSLSNHPSHPTLGIALAILATLGFALLDTTSQYVGKVVPVLMAVWFRFVVQAGLTAALLWPQYRRRLFITRAPGWQLARGVLMIGSSTVGFLSLRFLPVGEFTAIMMLIPLVITLLAALVLREHVPPMAWVLIGGGFAGALLVIQPHGSDFHVGMLLPLLLVFINALYQILTSHMVRTEDPGVMHFYTGLIGLACSSLVVPFGWQLLPSWHWWALVALLGVFGSVGHYLLIKAYRHAPASRLTPYLYGQLGFATLGGWLVFDHAPNALGLCGIGLIAICGLASARLRGG